MYQITNLHNLPNKESINVEFFFNNYKIKKEFFEKDIFINLVEAKKITKKKNEKEVREHNAVVCVRHSASLLSYTLPSVFIRTEDLEACQAIIQDYLRENVYNKVLKKVESRVVKIFDELTSMNIEYKKFEILTIDLINDLKNSGYKYDKYICMYIYQNLNKKKVLPTSLMKIYKKEYVNKEAIKNYMSGDKKGKITRKEIEEKQKQINEKKDKDLSKKIKKDEENGKSAKIIENLKQKPALEKRKEFLGQYNVILSYFGSQ